MRIIAGTARGKLLYAPGERDARPTLDRVKEAMFGMIQFDIAGRKTLDLFAGCGGLGMEALSRGALSAVFCDSNKKNAGLVKKNLRSLGFEKKAEVFCCDASSLLKRFSAERRKFSLVILDPPYASKLIERSLSLMLGFGLLEDGCLVIAEHDKKHIVDAADAGLMKRAPRSYGETAITLMQYTASNEKSFGYMRRETAEGFGIVDLSR